MTLGYIVPLFNHSVRGDNLSCEVYVNIRGEIWISVVKIQN